MPRKKRTQIGSSIDRSKKLVSSINEITTKDTKEDSKKTPQAKSLRTYRKSIADMTENIKGYAIELCKNNLLSVKMALMGAVREVEEMMKKNRED